MIRFTQNRTLPGFGPALGLTLGSLTLVVLIPLALLFFKTASLSPAEFWQAISDPRAVASFSLSFRVSLTAGLINALFGTLVAWVLVRYRFAGKGAINMLIDLPFALPTAIAGIALTTLFAEGGWIGRLLAIVGIRSAFTPFGIVLALTFIGLPFVVRTVQPVLQDLDREMEEAAVCLGANRFQTIRYVIGPAILPSIVSGFAMAFARGLGEYGSVVFIAGNIPMKTEVIPLLIMTKLEQYDTAGATAIATVMLVASFVSLFLINSLQNWSHKRQAAS